MSIIEPNTPVETQAVETASAPAEPVEAQDLFDAGADSFPREYVEKLRNEAADYRTKYAPYRDTFGEAGDDVRDYLLELNGLLLSPDKAAAATELRDLLKHLDPESPEAEAVKEAIEELPDDDTPLTMKQWKDIQLKEATETKEKEGIESIYSTARELSTDWANYDKDTDNFGDMAALLFVATNQTKGDLSAAHALREERYNKTVEDEVERRLGEIKSGNRKWAPVISGGGSPTEEPNTPKTWEDAAKSAKRRIAAIIEGGG
jgi:hypothetical protein